MVQETGQILILSAPSGAGKTTLAGKVLSRFPRFEFSVSATTRPPRPYEEEGIHYYFLDLETFRQRINENGFIEWEEVYPNRFYGTLRSEIDRIIGKGHFPVLDIDVEGGVNVKQAFGLRAVSVFVRPPGMQALEERLRKRKSESDEEIHARLEKAAHELTYADQYDFVVVNDKLDEASRQLESIIRQRFLQPDITESA